MPDDDTEPAPYTAAAAADDTTQALRSLCHLTMSGADQLRAAADIARALGEPINAGHSAVAHLYVPTPAGE